MISAQTKRYLPWCAVALMMIVAFAVNWSLLDIGLPNNAKADLLFGPGEREQVAPILKQLRDRIYAQITRGDVVVLNAGISVEDQESIHNAVRAYLLQTVWPDETQPVRTLQNIRPKQLQFDPRFYQYGALFFYSVGAGMQMGSWARIYPPPSDVLAYLLNSDYPRRLWLIPRAMGLFSFVLGIPAIFFFVRKKWGDGWGLYASALVTTSALLMGECHYFKPYNQAFLLNTIVYGLMMLAWDTRRPRYLYSAAVMSAISMGFLSTNGVLIALVAITAYLMHRDQPAETSLLRNTVVLLVCSFVVCNVWWVIKPIHVLHNFFLDPDAQAGRMFLMSRMVRVWTTCLPEASSCFMFATAFGGVVYGVVKRNYLVWMCLATLLIFTPYLAIWLSPHYVSAIFSVIVFLAIYALTEWEKKSPRLVRFWAACVLGYSLLQSVYHVMLLKQFDATYMQAGEWINANIPSGSTVGTQHITPVCPPFRFLHHKVIPFNFGTVATESIATILPTYYVSFEPEPQVIQSTLDTHYHMIARFTVKTPLDWVVKNYYPVFLNADTKVFQLDDNAKAQPSQFSPGH